MAVVGWAVRYPDLKIAMSEGGIGWVAMLIDRLDNMVDRSGYGAGLGATCAGRRAAPQLLVLHDRRPLDDRHPPRHRRRATSWSKSDYPHGDGTWPDTQAVIEKLWGHIPDDELRMMCSSRVRLYRHPLPAQVLP